MRIRKHAARILSALSVPAQPRAPEPAPGTPAAPAGREPEMHVCELNQSPWDAMAFSPPRGEDLYDYQELEDMEEELNCFLAGATLSAQLVEEELAAAVSDAGGCPTFIVAAAQPSWRRQPKIEETVEGAEEEGKRVRKIEAAKKRSRSQGAKKNKRKMASFRGRVGAEQEKVKVELEPGAAVTACKKTDGKGWHCKRPAKHAHSLCEYHLTQVRSYYSNGGGGGGANHVLQQHLQQPRKKHGGGIDTKQNAAFILDKKTYTKKKATTAKKGDRSDIGAAGRARMKPTSDFYYYYSGFGPWRRGKRRSSGCGGGGGGEQEAGNVDASDSDDEGDGGAPPRDGAPCPLAHDQGPDDLDDDDEDTDGGDEPGGCDGGDDVAVGRRRGRKPVKARSLKSLL